MQPIDIIVPYVDENDLDWQADFNYYKQLEIKQGLQENSNTQAFAKERTRDWEAFRYWFRGVEQNCPWVNKIFLVVQRKSQIPKWLNINNPKLRIVLHEEFIPKELLPTFSTLTIETFYYNIPDLSEYFIVSNDDFYFINPIPDNLFFDTKGIRQGFSGYRSKNWKCGNPTWEQIINNNNSFLESEIIKKPTDTFYHYSHLPDGEVKSFEQNFMNMYYDKVYKSMSISKFRHPKNLIPSLLYIDSMKYTNYGTLDFRIYKNSTYVAVSSQTNFKIYTNKDMICFNDTAAVDDFDICKNNLLVFLNSKLPIKSSFELTEISNLPTDYVSYIKDKPKNITPYLYF